ncbi:Mitochondrial carrier protein [Mycena indigotica]|uniref:Mitochondrial carrier protein n=1 Tax=Mycena indigotica TaxID=2126181 RepID=A0A8H6SL39_9AGAR|nr:Mitochondrial carrier protein [Mycena indigotica]KAF7301730.1 Mitochondrial carrier protein [Mycena indigotica]
MFGWLHKLHNSDDENAYEQVINADPEIPEHKAKLSHELIAAAAAYEVIFTPSFLFGDDDRLFQAAKKYEEHCAANGKPDSHAKAKELIAAFSAAFVDRMVETKGLDEIDREKAKHDAAKRAHEQASEILIAEYS